MKIVRAITALLASASASASAIPQLKDDAEYHLRHPAVAAAVADAVVEDYTPRSDVMADVDAAFDKEVVSERL